MKNKGFTLAELLAVITLLALILVFVLPKILNVYNNKKDEVKESKAGVIYSAADTYLKENIDDYPMTTGMEYCLDIEDLDNENLIPIDVTDITNETAGLKVKIGINGKKTYKLVSNCDQPVYSPGDLVYFDPVDSNECSESTFNLDNVKNGTSTCYKWRVITVGDTNKKKDITLQMDHNLVDTSAWALESKVSDGPTVALPTLETVTANWKNSLLLNYEYDSTIIGESNNYGILTCKNGTCTITGNNTPLTTSLKARMITKEEYEAFFNFFKKDEDGSVGYSNDLLPVWENLQQHQSCPTTANLYSNDVRGYWTLTPSSDTSYMVYSVCGCASGSSTSATIDSIVGLRPVITIPKSWIK